MAIIWFTLNQLNQVIQGRQYFSEAISTWIFSDPRKECDGEPRESAGAWTGTETRAWA